MTISGTIAGWRVRSFTPDPGVNYALVRDFAYGAVNTTAVVTFAGLTANQEYDLNFWSYDEGGHANHVATWSLTCGDSISGLGYNGDNANAQQTPYTLTGTADVDGALELTVSGSWRLNGFEVVAVPEPSTFALVGLAGLALLRRRRA